MGHNADLLRRSLTALDARDEADFRALIAPDGEMTSPHRRSIASSMSGMSGGWRHDEPGVLG